MPIVNPKDPATEAPIPTVVQIAAPEYKGVTVDTKMIPLSSLLSHVEGASWSVNYYSQVLDTDSGLAGQGVGTNPVHQQYRLIRQMELKVTQPLTMQQDPAKKTVTYSGTATVYPFVIPNEGDMFLADIGDGREGIFQITAVTRLSIFKQTCHTIDYQAVDYTDAQRLADFARKTVLTLQYDKDFLKHGQNPLLFEEDYAHAQYLRKNYKALTDRYFKQFFGREHHTMLVPLQLTPTYDPFITKALLETFSSWDSEEVRYVRQLNMDDDEVSRAVNLWTVLLNKDINQLTSAFTQVGKVYASQFSGEPMFEGIRFSGIKEVIYPIDPEVTVDFQYTKPPKLVSGSEITVPEVAMRSVGGYLAALRPKTLEDVIDSSLTGFQAASELEFARPAPVIFPAMKDGYYVLSEGFYKNSQAPGGQSQLEKCVRQYLNDEYVSLSTLRQLCELVPTWKPLDQFYFTPIVLILTKATLRSI